MQTESLTQAHPVNTGTPRFITLRINGEPRTLEVLPYVSLLDALREYLDLTGTKKGCDHGQCGALHGNMQGQTNHQLPYTGCNERRCGNHYYRRHKTTPYNKHSSIMMLSSADIVRPARFAALLDFCRKGKQIPGTKSKN